MHYANNKLINGLQNQLYISLLDQYHQPVSAKGELLEGTTSVATFTTNTAGVASVSFTPKQNTKYIVEAEYKGVKYNLSLINGEAAGIAINVSRENADYVIAVQATPAYPAQKLNFVIENEAGVLLKNEVKWQSSAFRARVPVKQLPSGIIRLAIITEQNETLVERFVFSNNNEAIASGNAALNEDEKGTGKFSVAFSNASQGTASVQLTDLKYTLPTIYKKENILNRFLFSSYLYEPLSFTRGLITNVEKADVDLLNSILATQKLIKIDWPSLSPNNLVKDAANDTNYIRIEGIVESISKKSLPEERDLNIILTTTDSAKAFFSVPVDEQGKFELKGMMFVDSALVLYQLNSKKFRDKQVNVKLTSHSLMDATPWSDDAVYQKYFYPVAFGNANTPEQKDARERYQQYDASLNSGNTLEAIVVKSSFTRQQQLKETENRYVSPLFSSANSKTMNFLVDPPSGSAWTDVINYLRRFSNQRFMVLQDRIIAQTSLIAEVRYTLYLDEGETNFTELQFLKLGDVAMIKIYPSGFIGVPGNGPALVVYTRKHSDIKDNSAFAIRSMNIPGYSSAVDFVLPKKNETKKEELSKYRTTFYWNPYILIDTDEKKIDVPYFNINRTDNAKVILEGFTNEGRIIYHEELLKK